MTATLHLFARFRDVAQSGRIIIPAPAGSTIADLRVYLKSRWPELAGLLDSSRFALNNEFVGDDHPLHSCDEPALIPPVSGG